MKISYESRPLGECVRFLSGGTPSKSRTEFWEGDIPWVSSGEMAQRHIRDTDLRITAEAAEEGSRLVPPNTVLVVVRGMSLAKEFRVAITKREVAFNQDLKALQCKEGIDSEFLFYSLLAHRDHIRDLATEASHGTKKLETDVLASFPVLVPKPDDQRRIASALCAYDDLIENNRRRMVLLEESARLLYQEWFVRLRFPGHEHVRVIDGVPEGWDRKLLGDCVTLNYGKALKADQRVDGPYPVFGSSGIVGHHDKPLVSGPGIIVGRKGNVGSVYWSTKDFYPIDTVYYIPSDTSDLYLYYALKHMHFISTDVAVPGLNRDFAYSRPLVIPSNTILEQFIDSASLLRNQVELLEAMNNKLSAARDLLLPRLMSGEVAV